MEYGISRLRWGMIGLSLLLSAALFGFFYAWICSTMWGLDQADPRVAISAMQAMNASVRNSVFAPAFFGAQFALLISAIMVWWSGGARAAAFLGAAAVITCLGGVALTMVVHIPMNEALAMVDVPADESAAAIIWADYSPAWQVWNITRTVFCGIAFILAVAGAVQHACYSPGLSAN